jgi:hypothetical protein
MAYTKTTVAKVAKRKLVRVPRFEKTPEWGYMKADIDKGLKPGEALQVVFGPEDQKKYHIRNRRSIARFIKKYLVTLNLPYIVTSFERRETGHFIILVKCAPVLRRRA